MEEVKVANNSASFLKGSNTSPSQSVVYVVLVFGRGEPFDRLLTHGKIHMQLQQDPPTVALERS
jgi:hypothetical protein